jgi:hypothetical protein
MGWTNRVPRTVNCGRGTCTAKVRVLVIGWQYKIASGCLTKKWTGQLRFWSKVRGFHFSVLLRHGRGSADYVDSSVKRARCFQGELRCCAIQCEIWEKNAAQGGCSGHSLPPPRPTDRTGFAAVAGANTRAANPAGSPGRVVGDMVCGLRVTPSPGREGESVHRFNPLRPSSASSRAWVPLRPYPCARTASYNCFASPTPGRLRFIFSASARAMPRSLMKCST